MFFWWLELTANESQKSVSQNIRIFYVWVWVERHRIHVSWSIEWSPQSVMIRAAMSSAGVDPLCFLKSTVNAAIYHKILEHFMLPFADKLMEMLISFSSRTWHLLTLPKLPKAVSMTMFVTVLDCSANSLDVNSIENLWGIVKRKMRDTRPNNADDLKTAIKATWISLHPSSATGRLTPCHAALMQ